MAPPRAPPAAIASGLPIRSLLRNDEAIAAFFVSILALSAPQHSVSEGEVQKVHSSAILIDTHNDVTSRTVEGFDIAAGNGKGHTDVPRLRKGGVGATFFAVYVGAGYVRKNRAAHRALEMIDTVRRDIVERHPGDFRLATTAADIEAAHREGKIAALMGIEGGHAIEDSLRLLRDFYDLGIRYMTLTHNNTNNWADSSGDQDDASVKHHNGLTPFGKDVVREMNRLGMMVDISHVSDKTFWDVLETSRVPVFASHSSSRALANIPRNMTDEMIAALAKKGGVVQVNFGCDFVSQRYATEAAPAWAKAKQLMASPGWEDKSEAEKDKAIAAVSTHVEPATLGDVVAQIEHIRDVGGIGAVGIGSDFDGVQCTPAGAGRCFEISEPDAGTSGARFFGG